MRVLVCGSRDMTDGHAIYKILDGYKKVCGFEMTVIQGDARGADRKAKEWATLNHVPCESYPAKWDEHGKAAGPIRNQQMLDEGKPDVVWAFKDNFDWEWFDSPGRNAGGTEDMVKRAKKGLVLCYVVSRA